MQAVKTQRKQPVQSRSRVTCEAIVEATVQVLLREGPARLTTTRVAKRAGVSIGTLYQYYPNKRVLVEAVRAQYFSLMSSAVAEALLDSQGKAPADILASALRAVIAVKRSNLPLSQALVDLPGGPSETDFSAEIVRHFSEFLLPLVAPDGRVDDQTRAQAQTSMAAIEGMMSFAVKNHPDWLHAEWFVDHVIGVAQAGLRMGTQGAASAVPEAAGKGNVRPV